MFSIRKLASANIVSFLYQKRNSSQFRTQLISNKMSYLILHQDTERGRFSANMTNIKIMETLIVLAPHFLYCTYCSIIMPNKIFNKTDTVALVPMPQDLGGKTSVKSVVLDLQSNKLVEFFFEFPPKQTVLMNSMSVQPVVPVETLCGPLCNCNHSLFLLPTTMFPRK